MLYRRGIYKYGDVHSRDGNAAAVFLVDYRFTVYRDRLDAYVDGLPQGNGYLYQERVRARIQRSGRGDETRHKRDSGRGEGRGQNRSLPVLR